MPGKTKRDADGVPHSRPGSVEQQDEDSFPASDSPSFSPGSIGAPVNRRTPHVQSGDERSNVQGKAGKRKSGKKPTA